MRPKNVPAPADGRERRCASPDDRGAHRTLVSFPRSGTALSGSVACRRTRLRRAAPIPALPPLSYPHSVGCQTCVQDETSLRPSKADGETEVSPLVGRPIGQPAPTIHDSHYGFDGVRVSTVRRAASEGSSPSTADSAALPTGFADCRLSPGWTTHSPWAAVLGGVRRPDGALRFRIGGGRSGQSDPFMAFPQGISGSGATPGRQGRGCESTLVAKPHQALGAGVRSRHGPCRPFSTADAAHEPQGVAAPADGRQGPV